MVGTLSAVLQKSRNSTSPPSPELQWLGSIHRQTGPLVSVVDDGLRNRNSLRLSVSGSAKARSASIGQITRMELSDPDRYVSVAVVPVGYPSESLAVRSLWLSQSVGRAPGARGGGFERRVFILSTRVPLTDRGRGNVKPIAPLPGHAKSWKLPA